MFNSYSKDLDDAEIEMLETYVERADIGPNQEVLDLGCGWGSFSLFAAQKFNSSNFTAVSNSEDQINYVNQKAKELGIKNLIAIRQDINQLNLKNSFDRVVSIEMFEHMRNYRNLLKRISDIMVDDGKLRSKK